MTGSSTSSTATTWRSESPAAPTSVDHNRARSPTTATIAFVSCFRPALAAAWHVMACVQVPRWDGVRSKRPGYMRVYRPFARFPNRWTGGESCARSEINREIRYETTCDATTVPLDLSDEAAARLIDFLLEIAHRMENHYSEQLYRYHNGIDERQPDLWSDTDPPF